MDVPFGRIERTFWYIDIVLAGAADTTTVIFRGSIVQHITPDRLRGRVSAADYIVGAGIPRFGNFGAGAVAAVTSPGFSAVSGGVVTVAGALLIRLAFPALAATGDRPSQHHRLPARSRPIRGSRGFRRAAARNAVRSGAWQALRPHLKRQH